MKEGQNRRRRKRNLSSITSDRINLDKCKENVIFFLAGELGLLLLNILCYGDIKSFAAVLSTIEGKTSDFGYIVKQTHDIICDKTAIIMEIQTSITSSKSEAYMMLIMPLVIVIAMSAMGSGFMDSLFTTTSGRIAATIGVISMIVSYVLAMKATNIDV